MSTYDGAYSEKKYSVKQPYWVYPCTCREKYEVKDEINPTCDRCNKRD